MTDTIDRRVLLQRLALLSGAAAMPDLLASEASVGTVQAAPALTRRDQVLVTAIADTLLPRTDTPGAVDAGVPALFARLWQAWASAERRSQWLATLAAVDRAALDSHARRFARLDAEQRHRTLSAFDQQHFASDKAYREMRELLITLYYLSEPGATQELRYEHNPGAWEPSVPLTEETRAAAGADLRF